MLDIYREKNLVKFKIQSGVLNYYWTLHIDCTDDVHAELLSEAFDKKLKIELKKIEEHFYNKGWKDAKAKVKKQTNFFGWWR